MLFVIETSEWNAAEKETGATTMKKYCRFQRLRVRNASKNTTISPGPQTTARDTNSAGSTELEKRIRQSPSQFPRLRCQSTRCNGARAGKMGDESEGEGEQDDAEDSDGEKRRILVDKISIYISMLTSRTLKNYP
jgi:hypothetical protein